MACAGTEIDKYAVPPFGKNEEHYMLCKNLHRNLYDWMRGEFLCDFTIQVEGEEIKAHVCVLASSCEFFKTLQTTDIGGDKSRCMLPCGSAETVRNILSFIYSHDIETLSLSWDNVEEYLLCADYLLCAPMTTCCVHFMCCELDNGDLQLLPQALILYHQYSQNHGAQNEGPTPARYVTYLQNMIAQLIMTSPNVLKESTIILDLEASVLVAVLKNEIFRHINMKVIIDIIIKWFEHDPEGRMNHVSSIFKSVVELHCLPVKYLQTISSHPQLDKTGLDQYILDHLSRKSGGKERAVGDSIIFVHADRENSEQPFLCSKYVISEDRWFHCKTPRGFNGHREQKQFECDSVYAEGFMYSLWWEDPGSARNSLDNSIVHPAWPARGVFKCYSIKENQWYNLPDPFNTLHIVGPCKLFYVAPLKRIFALGVEGHFISININPSGGIYQWKGCDGLPHRMTFDDFNYGYKKVLLKSTQLCYSENSSSFIYAYVPEALKENEYDEESHHVDKSLLYAYLARYNINSDRWDLLPSKMTSSGNITAEDLKKLNCAHLEVLTNSHHYSTRVQGGQFQIVSYLGKPILRYNIDLTMRNCFWEPINWHDLEKDSTVRANPLDCDPFCCEYYPFVIRNTVYMFDGPKKKKVPTATLR